VVVLLLVAAALVLPRLLDLERQRGRIEELLAGATGWHAELGRIDLSLLHGVALDVAPVRLSAPDGSSSIGVEALRVRAALWPLLHGRLDVRRVELQRPTLEIVRPNLERGWVLPPLPVAPEAEGTASGATGAARVSIAELGILDATLVIADRAAAPPWTVRLEQLDGTVQLATGEIEGHCRLGAGSGTLAWRGTLAHGLTFDLADVPTETFEPWLGTQLIHAGGRLAGQIDVHFPLDVEARLDATGLTLLAGKKPFPGARAELRVTQAQGQTYRLERFDFSAGAVRLTGRGTLLPALALQLDLPPTPLEAALAAAESVMPLPLVLVPPGSVEARLLVDQPTGAALTYEMRGKLSAARFELGSPLPPATGVAADFHLDRRGALEVRLRDGRLGGGPVDGTARLDSIDPPGTLRFTGGLRGAALGELMAGMVSGAAKSVAGDVQGRAQVGLDLGREPGLAALGGTLEIDAARVGLPGWDLEAALLDKLGSLSTIAELLGRGSGNAAAANPRGTPLFDTLGLRLDFDAKPWKLDALRLVAGSFAADGTGVFDPAAGTVDLAVTARLGAERSAELARKNTQLRRLLDRDGRLAVPLSLKGALLAPQVGVDLGNLLLGGESTEDAVRGVLQDLFKKK